MLNMPKIVEGRRLNRNLMTHFIFICLIFKISICEPIDFFSVFDGFYLHYTFVKAELK